MIKPLVNSLIFKEQNKKIEKKEAKNTGKGFFFIRILVTFARLLPMVGLLCCEKWKRKNWNTWVYYYNLCIGN